MIAIPYTPTRQRPARLSLLIAGCSTVIACSGSDVDRLTFDELIRACVVSSACGIEPRPGVGGCTDFYKDVHRPNGRAAVYRRMYRCALEAGSCEAVGRCFGAGASCDKETFKARCEGDRAITCDLLDDRVYELDCAAAGLGCRIHEQFSFFAVCGCDPDGFSARCDGDWAISCNGGGEPVGVDCGADGQRCRDGRCVGGESCDGSFDERCERDTRISCVEGRVARLECPARCRDGTCEPAGAQCDEPFNRCDGARLQACIHGRWESIDCLSLGLGACAPAENGANCSSR